MDHVLRKDWGNLAKMVHSGAARVVDDSRIADICREIDTQRHSIVPGKISESLDQLAKWQEGVWGLVDEWVDGIKMELGETLGYLAQAVGGGHLRQMWQDSAKYLTNTVDNARPKPAYAFKTNPENI